ncbi:uncharacterized protein DFL_007693 [Arthrobotrys flagrans]|uniref:Uncharacterized protein n=1 Tax=Arthrobotrys flagrans TaxID=97331 RepID=A0A436ZWN3_ARTFL|nr:hypothetical protein DFL_007693 [Arthrobotrys flagrans]
MEKATSQFASLFIRSNPVRRSVQGNIVFQDKIVVACPTIVRHCRFCYNYKPRKRLYLGVHVRNLALIFREPGAPFFGTRQTGAELASEISPLSQGGAKYQICPESNPIVAYIKKCAAATVPIPDKLDYLVEKELPLCKPDLKVPPLLHDYSLGTLSSFSQSHTAEP